MNARAGFLIVLLAAVFTAGIIRLYSIRFSTGDLYPDYSSLNASPDGAKLLYDSLARTSGVTVTRNFYPLDYLDNAHAAILFVGIQPQLLTAEPKTYDRLAEHGNRVVLALGWNGKDKPADLDELEKRWHIRFGFDKRLFLSDAGDWRVLDRDGAKILAIERDFASGSMAIFVASGNFQNKATVRRARLALVSAALGPSSRVIFDEWHFGIAESGTVVGLARRFRLGGMALGLALCTALFLWKNSASFPPPVAKPRIESLSGRTSMAGLVTLLRRHVKPADLAATCWNQWLVSHHQDLTPARRERAETILRERGRAPLDAVREIQTVFESKGPL